MIHMEDIVRVADVQQFGGKAVQLGKLMRHGYAVPPGFVVGVEGCKQVQTPGFREVLKQKIADHVQRYGQEGLMIRSSAVGEDGADFSFAGQLESYPSGIDPDEVMGHIIACIESSRSERVKVYEKQTQTTLKGVSVIVQQLINPDYAGVTFTRSPFVEHAMLIEWVQGHGQQLVSGEVTPESIHYDLFNGKAHPAPSINIAPYIPVFSAIEATYGQAMDIEWVIKDQSLWVVQARPVTTEIASEKTYWSNTNVNENYPFPLSPLLYSVARDAYYHYFKNLARLFQVSEEDIRRLEPQLCNIIGVFGGKMYYNMSSIHKVLSASPFAGLLIKSFDHFVGYSEGAKAGRPPATLVEKVRFIRSFLTLNITLKREVKAFEKLADQLHSRSLSAITLSELEAVVHGFMELRLHSWYRASLADFFAMTYHGLLESFCQRIYGQESTGVHNQLIQAIPGIVSSKPILEMYDILNAIRADDAVYKVFTTATPEDFLAYLHTHKGHETIVSRLEHYLEHWGFRCSGELMLTEETYLENPAKWIALLQQYDRLPDRNPYDIIAAKHQESRNIQQQLQRKCLKKYGWFPPLALVKIGVFRLLLQQSCLSISLRERARLKQALVYFRFKKTLEKIENHWLKEDTYGEKGDILMMTYKQIVERLHASDMLPQALLDMMDSRKKAWREEVNKRYPDDFYTHHGKYTQPHEVVVGHPAASATASDTPVFKGLCACGGCLTGRIVVLDSVMEAYKIQKGDILVTRQTDPGWVVVFPLISGLIVERGGMLSHGAIVAREFGIPAVVGLAGASQYLKDGDYVELRADRGEVQIITPQL
jgi:rifampicin phosphotransferase